MNAPTKEVTRYAAVVEAVDSNYSPGNAEAIALAAEAAKWAVYQQAIISGDITIRDLLDFAVDFYQDESWTSQLLAALDHEDGIERFAEQVGDWETHNSAEYKIYTKLKAKFDRG